MSGDGYGYFTNKQIRHMSGPERKPTLLTQSIDPDQPKHAAQAYSDIYFSPPVDFLFQESLLFISIPLRWNISTRISLRGLCRYITQRS